MKVYLFINHMHKTGLVPAIFLCVLLGLTLSKTQPNAEVQGPTAPLLGNKSTALLMDHE